MTEQTSAETSEQAPSWPAPGSALYAPALTQEDRTNLLAQLEQRQRESHDRVRKIDEAWGSPEAQKIREVVREDGNVDWAEFVKFCGGILEVVQMVDEYGLPDTDRIIPKVDELFNKDSEKEFQGGVTFRRHPRNRPYVPGRGTAAGEARAAERRGALAGGRDPGESDAETLLRAEQEAANAPRLTHRR